MKQVQIAESNPACNYKLVNLWDPLVYVLSKIRVIFFPFFFFFFFFWNCGQIVRYLSNKGGNILKPPRDNFGPSRNLSNLHKQQTVQQIYLDQQYDFHL